MGILKIEMMVPNFLVKADFQFHCRQNLVSKTLKPFSLPFFRGLFFFFANAHFVLELRRASHLLIIYFIAICIQLLSCFIVGMAAKSPFCLPSLLPLRCIGSRWNPVIIKPKDPFYPLRYHLSRFIQGIGSYLQTTKPYQTCMLLEK